MGDTRKHRKKDGGKRDGSKLHAAARSGDLRAIEALCCSDPLAVNSRDHHSRTPLHLAAWAGQSEVVSCLVKHKADVGATAMDDTGAIHFASEQGHTEIVRSLLTAGVSVKVANRKGLTPLHFAARGGHLELVKYLIKKGADVNAKSKSGERVKDVADGDEVQSYLIECEKAAKKGEDLTGTKKAVSDAGGVGNGEAASAKRGGDTIQSPDAKKGKVSLGHLVDDEEEDEEEAV